MFFGDNSELIEEAVMPDLLHVIVVGDNTVFNGILKIEHTTFGLCFFSDVAFLLVHTNHDTWDLRSSDNGREDSSRCIISSNTCLAHTRTIVNNNCG